MTGKQRNNFAISGIAVAGLHNFSFVFARWQHITDILAAICNRMIWVWPHICFSWVFQLTKCVTGPQNCTCQMASNFVKH